MKMENLQNKNAYALFLMAFGIFSTDATRWKEAVAYAVIGAALFLAELVFKTKELPQIDITSPNTVQDPKKDTFKTN